jgi:hypothetical protein
MSAYPLKNYAGMGPKFPCPLSLIALSVTTLKPQNVERKKTSNIFEYKVLNLLKKCKRRLLEIIANQQ